MEGARKIRSAARAMYLGSSLCSHPGLERALDDRHQTSRRAVSDAQIEDVIDLYGRVSVGARVIVI